MASLPLTLCRNVRLWVITLASSIADSNHFKGIGNLGAGGFGSVKAIATANALVCKVVSLRKFLTISRFMHS